MSKCKSCGSDIVWQKSSAGVNMPLDEKVITIITEDGIIAKGRISHFATCPNADLHRKK